MGPEAPGSGGNDMMEGVVTIAAVCASIVGLLHFVASWFQKDEGKQFNLEVIGLLYMIFARVMIHG